MSEKERAEMLATGLCFACKQHRHMSRNCPTKTTVKASGSRPPGTISFNLEPLETEPGESDNPVAVLDSLPFISSILPTSGWNTPLQ